MEMRDHCSLEAWQEARLVVLGTIQLSKVSWKPYAAALFSQLQKASLSVQLNIAEGYAYADSPSFTRHLTIAYGSAVETREILEIARVAGVGSAELIDQLLTRNQRSPSLRLGLLKWRDKARAQDSR